MNREDHVRNCKQEALAVVDDGKLRLAVDTMIAGMSKLDDFDASPEIVMSGVLQVEHNSKARLKAWIEGFN